jgi:hypothetical protein
MDDSPFGKAIDSWVAREGGEEMIKSLPAHLPTPGTPIPEADAEDMKAMLAYIHTLEPGTQTGMGAFLGICKKGTDIMAAGMRVTMLELLMMMAKDQSPAPEWFKDGQPDDAAFAAMARLPMVYQEPGVVRQGPPFDYEEFLRLAGRARD